jgi:hypothetical protein
MNNGMETGVARRAASNQVITPVDFAEPVNRPDRLSQSGTSLLQAKGAPQRRSPAPPSAPVVTSWQAFRLFGGSSKRRRRDNYSGGSLDLRDLFS